MISGKAEKASPFHVMEVLERARELESMGKDIIHLEIGEPDFPTAPHICEAASLLLQKVKQNIPTAGNSGTQEAIADIIMKIQT